MASPRVRRMRRALRLKAQRGTTAPAPAAPAPVVEAPAEEAPAEETTEEVAEATKVPRGLRVSRSGAKKATKKASKKTSAKANDDA